MSSLTGIESIALACLIKDNKDFFMLQQSTLDKLNEIFNNTLQQSIKDAKPDLSKQLMAAFILDKNIKVDIANLFQKGDFISVEKVLAVFNKIVSKNMNSDHIFGIMNRLKTAILQEKPLHEELEKIYIQILVRSQKWDIAIQYYSDILEEFEDNEDKYNMAKTHNNMGEIFQVKGEWNKAIGNFSKAIELYESLGDISGIANSYGSLGIVHQANQQRDKAVECFVKSLQYFEKDNNFHGKALTLNNLGLINQDMGDLEKANELFNQSWKIFEEDGDLQGMAQSKGNLSMLAFAQKEHKKAIKQFFEILFLYIKMQSEEQVNHAFSVIQYLTKQLESDKVTEIFNSVNEELSKEGISWGKHSILSADDVKNIYANLSQIKPNIKH